MLCSFARTALVLDGELDAAEAVDEIGLEGESATLRRRCWPRVSVLAMARVFQSTMLATAAGTTLRIHAAATRGSAKAARNNAS